MDSPKVSIIIPTYNRGRVLKRALKSVFNQTYQDFEVIVVDDASSDNTEKIVKEFNDSRIKFTKHEKNKGGSAARNTGIKNAKGKYIAFLDSDDVWLPKKLEKQIKKIKDSPENVGVTYTRYWIVKGNKKSLSKKPKKKGDIFEDQLFEDYITPTSCVLVKKSCFEKVGNFDEKLPARQDYDMWLRISKNYEFSYLEEPLAKIYHDPDPEKITTQSAEKLIRAEKIILKKVRKEIKNWPEKKQRKCITRHYFILGRRLSVNGKMKLARKYFRKSFKTNPSSIKSYLFYLVTFAGANTYKFLLKSYRKGRTLLDKT